MVEKYDNINEESFYDDLFLDFDPIEIEKKKFKARKSRKGKQKSKEKYVLSGYGHSLIKRLKEEKCNEYFEIDEPKYIEYERVSFWKPQWRTNETWLETYKRMYDNAKFVKTPYFEMDNGKIVRLYEVYFKITASYITIYDDEDNYIATLVSYYDFNMPNGKYEFSDDWNKMFIDHFDMDVKETFRYVFSDSGKNKRAENKAREDKYSKKLDKYQRLEGSSKIMSKKYSVKKRRAKTKNIIERAKKLDIDSDEFLDLMDTLPLKDTTEYYY